jgi:LacI family transcriptional regulator
VADITTAGNGHGRPTIRDIAALARVSPATVSRVINGRPEVSERVRERVLRVVAEHGYTVTRPPLSGMRSGLVGVMLPLIHHSYFSEILAGIGEAFYEHDIPMVLCPTLHEHDREVTLLQRLRHGITDGAILILPEEDHDELAALQEQGYPFVVIDPRMPPDDRAPTVSASHLSGAREATEHLLALGHRRIAAITGPHDWIATEERLRGYRGALAEAGITPEPQLQINSNFRDNGGRLATQQLLALDEPPTAIFAFNDMLAIGALQAIRQHGLRVPEDISVVGFDDTYEASITQPALTTIRQPLAEMGRMAVSQLVRLLQGQRIEALHVELATRLVQRGSTAPPRA